MVLLDMLYWKKYLDVHPADKGIFLETAHPVKFYDVVEPVIKEKIPLPGSVQSIINKKKESELMPAEFGDLKNFLLKN